MPFFRHSLALAALAACHAAPSLADDAATGPTRNAGVVVITGVQPSSLPTRIPTTIEGITGREIEERIMATNPIAMPSFG